MTSRRVLVDMSATLIHHGHVRILRYAHSLGSVTVALCSDEQIFLHKGYYPELSFSERREILLAFRYVDFVIESGWVIDDNFMDENKLDLLVHGDDNFNTVRDERVVTLTRTSGISSSELRLRGAEVLRLGEQN